jgi:hypothetical protein
MTASVIDPTLFALVVRMLRIEAEGGGVQDFEVIEPVKFGVS